jgi:hypothetical protein
VQEKLLAPLEAKESARSRYSRAGPPFAEHRVRLLDAAPVADGRGGAFVGFTVDARYSRGEGAWRKDLFGGCVYAGSGEVYVRFGQGFRAAGVLLGKKTPPAPGHVCRAAGTAEETPAG